MEWHVWDFPDNIRVYFKDEFRECLFKRLKEICGSRAEIGRKLKVSTTTIRAYFQTGHDSAGLKTYVPAKIIKRVIEIFGHQAGNGFSKKLEKNIIAYRCRAGWPVYDPILPIKESPGLYSIVCHMIGDGSAGKGKTPYYANTCVELRREFIKNLQIFGKVEVNIYLAKTGVTYIMFPKAVTDVLSYIFNVRFTYPNTLPLRLFITSNECKITSLRAMFDDEGYVSTVFGISQTSKKIIVQIKTLLESLGINTGKVVERECNNVLISADSYEKYKNLIDFTHPKKRKRLSEKIEKRKLHVSLKIQVMNLLSKKHPLTRREITQELNANFGTIQNVLRKLENRGITRRLFVKQNHPYLWYPTKLSA